MIVPTNARAKRNGSIQSTNRLATGETRDSVPKYAAPSGAVRAITPKLAEVVPTRNCHTRLPGLPRLPGRWASKAAYSFGPSRSRPATAAKESCKLTDAAAKGFTSKINSSAAEKEVGVSPSRPSSGASRESPTITQARTTDGVPPAIVMYNSSTG